MTWISPSPVSRMTNLVTALPESDARALSCLTERFLPILRSSPRRAKKSPRCCIEYPSGLYIFLLKVLSRSSNSGLMSTVSKLRESRSRNITCFLRAWMSSGFLSAASSPLSNMALKSISNMVALIELSDVSRCAMMFV
ncbi:MAG: hypothetical protein BWX71_02817 [Deltaproteobacteria bacterium ADurb.Bin072]|nr:MAG: hypothetical protein BWX71_02817 [Deltaproteobacteria bacterium ADurb.Bin072]